MVFAALADPTRRAILAQLAERDATVTELTAPHPISMPAVSRHLKVLEDAALISRTRSGKWRGSRLEPPTLRDAADWIERLQRFWDASLTRLDAHLAAVQAAEHAAERTANDPRVPDNNVPHKERCWTLELPNSPSRACSTRRGRSCTEPSPIRTRWPRGGDPSAANGRATQM